MRPRDRRLYGGRRDLSAYWAPGNRLLSPLHRRKRRLGRGRQYPGGNVTPQTYAPEEFRRIREHQANGMGGLPLVGDPDTVARELAQLAAAGLTGIAVSFVNYLDELPYFCAEVLPRLARSELREKPGAI